MSRTLKPDSRIAHYRIVGPLGAGGMGEVYRAQDEKLGRDVALKILPPGLVGNDDRVRRFVLEARSASSLNHPNIVTIYDVGHGPVEGDGEDAGAELHYIAMELVIGKTVQELVHDQPTPLKTLIGYLAQAAEGLAKAHSAGIVHRDLKPGNVMVTTDGYAKVLDFGLAKLTEKTEDSQEMTSAPTATGDLTGVGLVVGTVGYMAPEQVRGKAIDHRADIFSFGCLLYEAATRQKPFAAESNIDTLHRLLHDNPTPIDVIDPTVPTALRRLIKRCLAKDADQRLQSMKDLAIELREIVDEYDHLTTTAASGSIAIPAMAADAPNTTTGKRRLGPAIAVVAILGMLALVFGIVSVIGTDKSSSDALPFESSRMSPLLSGKQLFGASLSRDGRYLAYVVGPSGQWSMHVRQVATGSDVQILPPSNELPQKFTFSPDGNYLYLLKRDPEARTYSALFEVPSLGGEPRKRLFDIDTAVTFAPDGRQVAFLRGLSGTGTINLMVADLDGGDPRVVAAISPPENAPLNQPPAWSPDGSRILVTIQNTEGGIHFKVVAFSPESGERMESLLGDRYINIISMTWAPDGRGIVVAGLVKGSLVNQIEYVSFPDGERRQLTNDLDNYGSISLTDDGQSLVAIRQSGGSTAWIAGVNGLEDARAVTSDPSEYVTNTVTTDDGTLVYVATAGGFRQVFAANPDGSSRRRLSRGMGHVSNPMPVPGRASVAYTMFDKDDIVGHIYVAPLDGGAPTQLTDGTGDIIRSVSPDGETVYFVRPDNPTVTMSVPVTGGDEKVFLTNDGWPPQISPDGRFMAYGTQTEIDGRSRNQIRVEKIDGGPPIAEFLQQGSVPIWTPDSRYLTYLDARDPQLNVWKIPREGGEPVQVTHFEEGRLGGYRWSPDGSMLVVGRSTGVTRNLWVVNADGTDARQVTDFRDGQIFNFDFTADGTGIVLSYGDIRTDVVMIRDTSAEE